MKARWLPHPLLSLVLLLVWLLLVNSLSFGQLLIGTLAAWAIPLATRGFWPEPVCVRHPLRLLRFIALVGYDIITANLTVARLIVMTGPSVQPALVSVPLTLRSDLAISLLTNVISLTPGTLSARLSADKRTLLVHALHVQEGDDLVAEIKSRYEQPLLEVFEPC